MGVPAFLTSVSALVVWQARLRHPGRARLREYQLLVE
jgi:hypothetical protein